MPFTLQLHRTSSLLLIAAALVLLCHSAYARRISTSGAVRIRRGAEDSTAIENPGGVVKHIIDAKERLRHHQCKKYGLKKTVNIRVTMGQKLMVCRFSYRPACESYCDKINKCFRGQGLGYNVCSSKKKTSDVRRSHHDKRGRRKGSSDCEGGCNN